MDAERAGLWTGVGVVMGCAAVAFALAVGVLLLADWLYRRGK